MQAFLQFSFFDWQFIVVVLASSVVGAIIGHCVCKPFGSRHELEFERAQFFQSLQRLKLLEEQVDFCTDQLDAIDEILEIAGARIDVGTSRISKLEKMPKFC